MQKVVSVSLGSSTRNHEAKVKFLGKDIAVERIGTDGDMKKAIETLRRLDGQVSAIGLGGIDLYLYAGNRRYTVRDAKKLREAVKNTPIVDGSGLKDTLERETIRYLSNEGGISFNDKKVLMVSAVDRFGMAEALHEAGAKIIFGDLIFGLGIPIAIRSMTTFRILARLLLPIVTKMPFKILYPTGSKQEEKPKTKYSKYYEEAEIIAGDFLFIRKYLPQDLSGKIIITNTITKGDVEELKKRKLATLITTTPELNGRSFGTNVMEAMLVSLINKNWSSINSDDYLKTIKEIGFKPRIEILTNGSKQTYE
jgi:hypothetical protein